jgi:hypothetical protein
MTVALRIAAGGCCRHSRLLSLDVCEAEQALGPAAPLTDGRAPRQRQAGMKTSEEPGECSRLEARRNSAPPRPTRHSRSRPPRRPRSWRCGSRRVCRRARCALSHCLHERAPRRREHDRCRDCSQAIAARRPWRLSLPEFPGARGEAASLGTSPEARLRRPSNPIAKHARGEFRGPKWRRGRPYFLVWAGVCVRPRQL